MENFFEVFRQDDDGFKSGLLLVDLIAKLLSLTDVTTNGENFGFLLPEKSVKIIDFIIGEQHSDPDYSVYERILGGKIDLSLDEKCRYKIFYANLNENLNLKLRLIKSLIKTELKNFVTILDDAELFVIKYASEKSNEVCLFTDEEKKIQLNILKKYTNIIKSRFEMFCEKIKLNIN